MITGAMHPMMHPMMHLVCLSVALAMGYNNGNGNIIDIIGSWVMFYPLISSKFGGGGVLVYG